MSYYGSRLCFVRVLFACVVLAWLLGVAGCVGYAVVERSEPVTATRAELGGVLESPYMVLLLLFVLWVGVERVGV